MDSVLETFRKSHEERERLVDTISKEMLAEKKTHKAKINSEIRVKGYIDKYQDLTKNLIKLYTDEDRSRADELRQIAGPNEFAEFYSRLKLVKDSHRRNPEELAEPLSVEYNRLNDEIAKAERVEPDLIEFTDEEAYGRFLDLNTIYLQFVNLKNIKKVDYMTYLTQFDRLSDIPKNTKKTGAYKEYIEGLEAYLISFMNRTRPLFDLEDEFQKSNEKVTKDFENGKLTEWVTDVDRAGPQMATVDLSPYNSAKELEGLGLERLKGALMALGLKCGGTLEQRAERLFATKGHSLSELEKAAMSSNSAEQLKQKQKNLNLAKIEARIQLISEVLAEEKLTTRENVERKQARAAGEYEEEEEPEAEIESDPEEYDDGVPYNPKNLPLGWDGKPIPYWLYKLHGLNLTYSCEICGNQQYKGPKAFQKHFNEWKHSHGMRCLGIPNTPHFGNITKIKDALDLWQKIKVDKETQKWNPDMDEEYEDSAGNVVTKKMYEDLKREGLL